jgi:hypothetical protein
VRRTPRSASSKRLSCGGLLPLTKGEQTDFIELPALAPLMLLQIIRGPPRSQLFEHAHIAVGLDERESAPFTFGLDLGELASELPMLYRKQHFVSVNRQQRIDIRRARRLQCSRTCGSLSLLRLQFRQLAAQHFFGTQCLSQLGAALVALAVPQSE